MSIDTPEFREILADVQSEPYLIMDESVVRLIAHIDSRTAPVSAPLDTQALPAIERDEQMDRTYIPLPGGWEVQTKGKGSTFRIAHVPASTRWMVLADELHEPLEAMARDTRNLIEQQAERIRHLERELAERKPVSIATEAPQGIEQEVAAVFRGCGFEVREYLGAQNQFTVCGSLDSAAILLETVMATNKAGGVERFHWTRTGMVLDPNGFYIHCRAEDDRAAAPTPINSGMEEAK